MLPEKAVCKSSLLPTSSCPWQGAELHLGGPQEPQHISAMGQGEEWCELCLCHYLPQQFCSYLWRGTSWGPGDMFAFCCSSWEVA